MIWGENMGDITREKLNHFRKHHRIMRRYTAAFLAAAALVGCGVGWSLHQTGISATAEAFCGEGEHKHTEACFEKVLICGLEEGQTLPTQEPHTHGESCYELQTVNVCGEEAHTHTEDCYTLRRDLTCGEEDHTHGDGCYCEIGGDLTCGLEEHTHGEDCLDEEGNLVCTKEEHTHNDGCYAPVQRVLTCTRQEHIHSDVCYGEPKKVLICTQKEHTHVDGCFEEKQVLVCTLPEGPREPQVHTHSESCYEERLTCGKEEHTHTEQCLSDSTADVEGPEDWKANSGAPGTGNWAYDLYMVACAQMGYQESQKNFILDATGTRQGYTRYGAWYGDPYGSWNGMFVAYCLHFAGVPEDVVSQRAGVNAMLAGADPQWVKDGSYTPKPGDIVIFDNRLGVVSQSEPLQMIVGDVDGKVSEKALSKGELSAALSITEAYTASHQAEDETAVDNASDYTMAGSAAANDYAQSVTVSYGENKSVTLEKNGDSPTLHLVDGEAVQICVTFRFPNDLSTAQGTYQLPSSFDASQNQTGDVLSDSGDRIGTYVIDGNGLATITYLDDAVGQIGYLSVDGKVNASGNHSEDDFSFPGIGNVAVSKMEETVHIEDHMDYVEISYGQNQTVTVKNGNPAPTIELKDGDPIDVRIYYHFPNDLSTKKGTYQLPDGINPTGLNGTVTDGNNKVVGSFVIDENGLITVTYNDEIWDDSSPQSGHLYFSGTASVSGDHSKDDLFFEGAGTIRVDKKEEEAQYDSSLQKRVVQKDNRDFALSDDGSHVKVTYQVELSTKNGTGTEALELLDKLNDSNDANVIRGKYDEKSFKLVRQKADGTSEDDLLANDGIQLKFENNEVSNKPTASVTGLPALSAGEKYIMTYDVLIPKDSFIGNDFRYVKNSVKDSRNDSREQTINVDRKLQKTSSFDKNTGRITWTITVDDPIGSVKDFKVWDVLPKDLNTSNLYGDIQIVDRNWSEVKVIKESDSDYTALFDPDKGYTFADGSNPPYRITFQTTVPDLGDAEQIELSNTAKLQPTEEPEIEVVRTETVTRSQWKLAKSRGAVQGNTVSWGLDAQNVLGSKDFTVKDTLQDARKDGDWSGKTFPGTHFGKRDEIEAALQDKTTGLYAELADGTRVFYADAKADEGSKVRFEITYTEASETGAVTAFSIHVTSEDQSVMHLHADAYPTHVDFTKTPEAETWIFTNKVSVGKDSAEASYSYTNTADFVKKVSIDGKTNFDSEYGLESDVTLGQINQYSGYLYYKIQLTTDAAKTDDIVVTDKIPEGSKFVCDYECWTDKDGGWYGGMTAALSEDGQYLVFTLKDYNDANNPAAHTLTIHYRLKITDDPRWSDTLIGSVNYQNVAQWGTKTAETTTLVKRYNSQLAKEGAVLPIIDEETGKKTDSNRIQYTVVINPDEQTLSGWGDTKELEDTLTFPNGIVGSLDFGSIRLYKFKDKAGTLDLSSPVTAVKTEYDPLRPNWFRITMPTNEMPLVLRYVCEIDTSTIPAGTDSFQVGNKAKIGDAIQAGKNLVIQKQLAGGSISGNKLRILKRDADSGDLLPGATFQIEQYVPGADGAEGTWNQYWQGVLATGEQEYAISAQDSVEALRPYVLYRIAETNAPEHYELDNTPKYVIFYLASEGPDGAFQKATGAESIAVDGVTLDKNSSAISYNTLSGITQLHFTNRYTRLDVKKVWVNAKDEEIVAPVDEIKVKLLRYTDSSANAEECGTAQLTKTDGWSYSWSGLEKTDKTGKAWHYKIEEVLPSENWKLWTVSYANNGGIQTGLIQVKNTVSDEFTYELPKTGGTGTQGYVFFGTVAMLISALAYFVQRKKGIKE